MNNNKYTGTSSKKSHTNLRVVHIKESYLENRIKERIVFLESQKVKEKLKEFKGESPVKIFNKSIGLRQAELRWVLGQVA